jgi:hypothetical protein
MKLPFKSRSRAPSYSVVTIMIVSKCLIGLSSAESNFPCAHKEAIVIDGAKLGAGTLETPGFPDRFDLPLECGWVITNANKRIGSFVNIYFTQVSLYTVQYILDSRTCEIDFLLLFLVLPQP